MSQSMDASLLGMFGRYDRGVLATIRGNGRPQLSNVNYAYDELGPTLTISITDDRAKTRNLQRDPRATLSIVAENWSDYLVVEGTCAVHEEDVLPELRRIYERVRGEPHPNWAEFDAAMLRDGRVVLAITIDRMYPLDR